MIYRERVSPNHRRFKEQPELEDRNIFGIDDLLVAGLLGGGGALTGLLTNKKNPLQGALLGGLGGAGLGIGAAGIGNLLGGAGAAGAGTAAGAAASPALAGLPSVAGNPALMGATGAGLQGAGAGMGLGLSDPALLGPTAGSQFASTGALQTPLTASGIGAAAGNPALAGIPELQANSALMGGPAAIAKGLTPMQIMQLMNNPITRRMMAQRQRGGY